MYRHASKQYKTTSWCSSVFSSQFLPCHTFQPARKLLAHVCEALVLSSTCWRACHCSLCSWFNHERNHDRHANLATSGMVCYRAQPSKWSSWFTSAGSRRLDDGRRNAGLLCVVVCWERLSSPCNTSRHTGRLVRTHFAARLQRACLPHHSLKASLT